MQRPRANRTAQYLALICDKDGTLTKKDRLAGQTRRALARWTSQGRKLVLATGETTEQLSKFEDLGRFDIVVAENGGVLFNPISKTTTVLAKRRPPTLVKELNHRGVTPHTIGHVIVSAKLPEAEVLESTLQSLHLDWWVIHNRDEVMALPKGIDKSTGVRAALKELAIPAQQAVGIGDAQNDVVLLRSCGLGVAVATAVDSLKRQADFVTEGGAGTGIVELIDNLLAGEMPICKDTGELFAERIPSEA